ncbi:major facilitator superfamily domain-containing protein [Infundibulicybe gibba]|nr:major facilitator superfamily domain-containing protein [Infundibulicybe gibba]
MGFVSRLPRLPPRDSNSKRVSNPIRAMRDLSIIEQTLFWSGLFAWLSDSYDFFCVSLTIIRLQAQFGQSTHALTTAITLTLLLRPFGAIFFGLLSDRFGRKWPLVSCLMVISVLQIGTGFVTTFSQFLAVRSLFGVAMGGVWGLASATSIESMPVTSRGLYSGLMQSHSQKTKIFLRSLRRMLKTEWKIWIYGVVLLSGLNFLAHGSQDLYTTFMQNSKGFSASLSTKANIIGEVGAVVGAAFGGLVSQFLGRRVTLVLACIWIIPNTWGVLSLGAFFFQVGCAFQYQRINVSLKSKGGTVAIYLNELAPPAFRGLYPGTVYQIGNAASAAAAQIEATAGLSIRTQVRGVDQPDYGKIQAIVAAASCSLILFCALFENERTAIEEDTPTNFAAVEEKGKISEEDTSSE